MRDRFSIRVRRFMLVLATGFVMVAGLPAVAVGEDCTDRPSAPFAIDRNVFNGLMKGLVGTDEILVSTRLGNAAWTGFSSSPTTSTVTTFVNEPETIPVLRCGDRITLAGGNSGAAYSAMEARFQAGSVIVLPVVMFDTNRGAVAGFVTVQILEIRGTSNPKYLHGTILTLELDPNA